MVSPAVNRELKYAFSKKLFLSRKVIAGPHTYVPIGGGRKVTRIGVNIMGFFAVLFIIGIICFLAFIASIHNDNKSAKEAIRRYERQKQEDEADRLYYLQHKDDKDQSKLDKDRMERGQFRAAFNAVVQNAQRMQSQSYSSGGQAGYARAETDYTEDNGDSSSFSGSYQKDIETAYIKGFSFVDASGAHRKWGDDFIDYKGNWCSWGGSFYDKELNYRSWGETFVDGCGNFGSLRDGFYDAAGNWIPGYPA